MTKEELYKHLTYVNSSRENRLKYAQMVLNDKSLFPKLLSILFMLDDKVSCRAAWVLEFTCNKDLEVLISYLDIFTKNIHKVHLDSAVRPVAKVCEYLVKAYYSKHNNNIKIALKPIYQERIIEACFDWMITDQKVAVKAYSMNSLYLLGQDYDWVHPELKTILERGFHSESAGFKARARHLLKKIK
ncbi:MAG: adenylosuccinate lyase [Bacteroidetes bacterium]|nr:MAG: adenylosuccinate lyase [Bacteroidota bacterium]